MKTLSEVKAGLLKDEAVRESYAALEIEWVEKPPPDGIRQSINNDDLVEYATPSQMSEIGNPCPAGAASIREA